jgi:preprotein translocase subunit YajC
MFLPTIYDFIGLALLAQEGGGDPAVAPLKDAPKQAPGLFDGLGGLWLPIMLVLAVYLFLMILPGRRDQRRTKQLMESLKKNDRVLTSAGIKGTIVNISPDSPWATIRIDEATNTKMQILRSSITRVLAADDKDNAEGTETK